MLPLTFRLHFVFAIVLLLILSSTTLSTSIVLGAPTSIVTEADKSISEAYDAVLDAERAGANVSGLVARLNEAGGLLTNALMADRTGDFEETASSAAAAESISQEVRNNAYVLKNRASVEAAQHFRSAIISSVVGMVLIVVGSLWGWRIIKRIHSRQILKMKPEVFSNEP